MTGSDKQVFIEIWRHGILINRKLKDEKPAAQDHSLSMRSTSVDPMRPGSVLPHELEN